MVIWLFAGGGEAEVRGLVQFFQHNFKIYTFIRKSPIRRKPGPKPNKKYSYGKTGQSLIEQIVEDLPIALRSEETCDLILIFDDLDCRNPDLTKQEILQNILAKVPKSTSIEKFVGFAAPEIEAWIIRDWNNSVARHPNFRGRHQGMCHWLSTQKKVDFTSPESFSEYDRERKCCRDKLSEALIDASVEPGIAANYNRPKFSKGKHTPELLLMISPSIVQQKCPLFRELYNYLNISPS